MKKRWLKLAGSIGLLYCLIYSRFINLGWGLPYPFHPDERNIADSLTSLTTADWFNPHFFAYGQLTTYIGYSLIKLYNLVVGNVDPLISFSTATLALRLMSAVATIANSWLLYRLFRRYQPQEASTMSERIVYYLFALACIFSPFFIQFSHFGTTEAILMLIYTAITYILYTQLHLPEPQNWSLVWLGLLAGIAVAIKISSLSFLALPLLLLLYLYWPLYKDQNLLKAFFAGVKIAGFTICFGILLSPYNLIDSDHFTQSFGYESGVALGKLTVFYTGAFIKTVPIAYQFVSIFPYALGWPMLILFVLGFLLLPFKREYNLLRLSFLLYFLPSSFVFTKWTRFLAPIFPIMVLISLLYVAYTWNGVRRFFHGRSIVRLNTLYSILLVVVLIPGVAYLAVYRTPDVRFQASDWIYRNMPLDAYILSETANVIDIPIQAPHTIPPATQYRNISFNFYDIDQDPSLLFQLRQHLSQAQYIFVPSRRIFANYSCELPEPATLSNQLADLGKEKDRCYYLAEKYPILRAYYNELFHTEVSFKKIKEFTVYPNISLFGHTFIEFPDEYADETWSVFDHPVIRIYGRK